MSIIERKSTTAPATPPTGYVHWFVDATGHPQVLDDTGASHAFTGPTGPTGPTGATGADSTVPGPTGPRGLIGPIGPIGAAGAAGAASTVAGPPGASGGMQWAGAWSAVTYYPANSVTYRSNALYVSTGPSTGIEPPTGAPWVRMAVGATLPPVISFTGGPTTNTHDTTPTITGTTDSDPGSVVSVTIDTQVLTSTTTATGTWAVTADTLVNDVYTVRATVTGPAGTSFATQTLTIAGTLPVPLGTAATYSVLASTGVANTGATTLAGDLGVSPSNTVTAFPPGTYSGVLHAGDTAAATARADMATAYDNAAARVPDAPFAGDLNGQTRYPGVYHTSAAMALTGILTLDALGDSNAVFLFQIDAAMDTAAASSIVLAGGAQASNVFWVVAGAVGTGASSHFTGTILSAGAVIIGAGATLTGRAFSYGTVTLSTNTVTFD